MHIDYKELSTYEILRNLGEKKTRASEFHQVARFRISIQFITVSWQLFCIMNNWSLLKIQYQS